MTHMKIKIVGVSVLVSSFLISSAVFAVEIPSSVKTRLQDAKLRACQARESAIKTRSSGLGKLADSTINHFDKIATRVENYYTNTVVPSGKTVPNYDQLVSDIQTKKEAAEAAVKKASDDATQFLCTSDDPKAALTKFKDDMQLAKKALGDYRTSIKNLIVAIRSVVGDENNSDSQQNEQENNQ